MNDYNFDQIKELHKLVLQAGRSLKNEDHNEMELVIKKLKSLNLPKEIEDLYETVFIEHNLFMLPD